VSYPAWREPTDAERAVCEHLTADLDTLPGHVRGFAVEVRAFVQADKITDNLSVHMCRIVARSMSDQLPPAVVQLARAELDRMRQEAAE
jgi:hypothetical protein